MKKFVMLAMSFMALTLSSCSDVDSPETVVKSPISKTSETRSSDTCLLYFESKEDFDAEVAKIATLSSDEEKMRWVDEKHPGFKSIQTQYWEAMAEMAEMTNVDAEHYNAFEQKHKSLYFPKFMEDAGFYVPMTNLDAAFLANENCEISIAGKIIDLQDVDSYNDLVEVGRAYYAIESPMPLSTMTSFSLSSTSMNSVGPEYDSGWTQYDDRKVKLKARRKFNTIPMATGNNGSGSESVIHLEFCFRKKTWLGWSNYSSKSTIVFKATIPFAGILGPVSFAKDGNSSHDSELQYPIRISSDATHWYYTFDEAPCEASITYQGVSHTLIYNWSMPGIQCVTPISANHAPILPYI